MKKIVIAIFIVLLFVGCAEESRSIVSRNDFVLDENGHLFFKGEDLGNVRGTNGKDGLDGVDGKNGKNGLDGKDGLNGVDGNNGIDGENSLEGMINGYVDLSKFNIGDQLPFKAGLIPFDWKIDENTYIKVNSISFVLKAKYDLEKSKTDLSQRMHGDYYPFLVEFIATGTAPIEYANKKYVVVVLGSNHAGYGSGGIVKTDGSFEARYEFGINDYFIPLLNEVFFEDCNTDCFE